MRGTAALLLGAIAAGAGAQITLQRQAPPRGLTVPRPTVRPPAIRPIPGLTAAQRTAGARQLTGSATIDGSASPIHFSVSHPPGGHNSIGFINAGLVSLGSDPVLMLPNGVIDIQVRSGEYAFGKGLHLYDCSVGILQTLTWSGYKAGGTTQQIGGSVPVDGDGRAVFVVDLSSVQIGSISLSGSGVWGFDHCDVTPLK